MSTVSAARGVAAVTCGLCGFTFDPSGNPACPSCPLASGCTVVCCPRCGHDTVDTTRSSLVRLGSRLAGRLRRHRPAEAIAPRTLADVGPGETVRVRALDGLDHDRREHLQAYGVVPGRHLHVVQHAPVTVVQVEHTQVAFESHLADGIAVEPAAG